MVMVNWTSSVFPPVKANILVERSPLSSEGEEQPLSFLFRDY